MKAILCRMLAVVIAVMAVSSCSTTPSMESIVAEVNKNCPIRVPGVGQIKTVDFADNTLTYHCQVMNRSFNIKSLEGHEEAMKSAILPMLPGILNQGTNPIIAERLVDEGSSMAIRYYTVGTKAAEVTVSFTPEEIKAALDGNIPDDPETKLKTQLALASAQCPQRVDAETTLTGLEAKDHQVIYIYEMNEKRDPEIIKEYTDNLGQMREILAKNLHSNAKDIKEVVKLCKEAGYGITYRYVGSQSGATLDVAFTPDEL